MSQNQQKGRVVPLSTILKWGGLNFKDGVVIDSCELAIALSRVLTYGLKSFRQAREEGILARPIKDQVDMRIYELLCIMLDKIPVIAEEGWDDFWEHVLVALSWVDVGAGTPDLRATQLADLVDALAEARARGIHNVGLENHRSPFSSYLPKLDQWLEYLDEGGKYPDAAIADWDTCKGVPIHDGAVTEAYRTTEDQGQQTDARKRALDMSSLEDEATHIEAVQYHSDKKLKVDFQETRHGIKTMSLEANAAERAKRINDIGKEQPKAAQKTEEGKEKIKQGGAVDEKKKKIPIPPTVVAPGATASAAAVTSHESHGSAVDCLSLRSSVASKNGEIKIWTGDVGRLRDY